MAATTYSDPSAYRVYTLGGKKRKHKKCGCGGKPQGEEICDECEKKEPCGCDDCQDKDKKCGCCPPGLVSVFDDNDEFIGCLTPNDAELYVKNSLKCNDGFGKLYRTSDGEFLGCFNAADYATLYALVNPA